MTVPDRDHILAALDRIKDPKTGRGLQAAGLVQGLIVGEGRAGFMLEVAAEDAARYAPTRDAAEAALKAVPGVDKASVVLTAAARSRTAPAARHGHGAARAADDPRAGPSGNIAPAERIPHVKRVIVVASGKGGVGKSTVAVNLACAFAHLGLRTGLLDADMYGPSVHRMLGCMDGVRREDGETLIPLEAWNLKFLSMGNLADEKRAVPWRGPMVSGALNTFMRKARWGTEAEPLDLLVIDLPPGTGDIHMTLNQSLVFDGAVIVSTPQEIAVIDVRRAAAMFALFKNPILGLIENMAYFPDPATGARIPIFGEGGGKAEAARLGVPVLAEIPIDIALREGGDLGRPLVATEPDGPVGKAFIEAAKLLA